MVAGEVLIEAGRFTRFDFEALRGRAADAVTRLAEVNGEARALAEKLEPYVNQFCTGLAARPHAVHAFCSH
jgi:hypothetical protein